MIGFTKEHFVVELRLSLPSFLKQFLHFTQIPYAFLHLNIIWILMGCSVLGILFHLDISLLEVLFIYQDEPKGEAQLIYPHFFSRVRTYLLSSLWPIFQTQTKARLRGMFWCLAPKAVHLRVRIEFLLYNVIWRFQVNYVYTIFVLCWYYSILVANLLMIFMFI